MEYFHLFHPFGIYSSFPSIWNILVFSHFMPISQGEGLCAQKKLQPLVPPNCLLEGTGPKSSGLAYLFTIFLFLFLQIIFVYKFFNSDLLLFLIQILLSKKKPPSLLFLFFIFIFFILFLARQNV